jgi:hypothetical protein
MDFLVVAMLINRSFDMFAGFFGKLLILMIFVVGVVFPPTVHEFHE